MDIITHALIGAAAAAPFYDSYPLAALSFVVGSCLPDLDALTAVLGRRRYLGLHQTLSHGLPVAAAAGLAWGGFVQWAGLGGAAAGAGLAAGMALHVALDWTNTYGVTPWAPFSWRRRCAEWVLFIDAGAIAATSLALAALGVERWISDANGPWISAIWAAAMAAWWAWRARLRARVAALGPPDALAWIPSALWPWRYYGCAREGGAVRLLTADARRGEVFEVGRAPVLDGDWADALAAAPEFALMRALSPAYHVVEARAEGDGTYLAARDLRTRNFGTRFGALELWLDAGRQIRRRRWHV